MRVRGRRKSGDNNSERLRTNTVIAAAFCGLIWVSAGDVVLALDTALSETPEVQFSALAAKDLKDKADELASPAKIYEFIRNNFQYQLYHGSRSGSINSFLGGRGSDVDLASTLIAMFRSRNIPARYVVGNIKMSANDVTNWLRVKDLDLAVNIMNDQGIQNVSLSVDRTFVEFEHVWVEVQVPYDNYRGGGSDAGFDMCDSTPTKCHWVSLDPSFKLKQYHNQNIDIYNVLLFDYTSYFNAINVDDATRKDKNPLEIYEEQILTYLQTTPQFAGKTLEDVADPGVIIREEGAILPNSLPYLVVDGTVRRYNSVADHDAGAGETRKWAKAAKMFVVIPGLTLPMGSYLLSDLATKRMTLTWETGTPSRLVACLDGVETSVPLTGGQIVINNQTVGLGYPFTLKVDLSGAPSTEIGEPDNVISVTYNNLVVGGYYLIGTGGDSSNFSQVHRAADQLLQANQEHQILNDPTGIPYVDVDKNGTIDTGEPRLLDDPTAMDALTGGLLYTAMTQYFAKFRDGITRLDRLNHVISPIEGFVGVVSSVYDVEYVGGTAFAVLPGGLLIDMKGQKFSGSWRTDASAQLANEHFEFVGHMMSSLEHEIWQEMTGYDAVSTVRGTQMALANGAALVDAKKNSMIDTLPAAYPSFGFATQAPSPFVRRDSDLFGTLPTTWYLSPDDGQVHTFDMFKGSVDATTPSLRRLGASYASNNNVDSDITSIVTAKNQLEAGIAQFGQFCTANYFFGGASHSGSCTTVLNELQAYYLGIAAISTTYQLLDRNNGFVPTDYVYRNESVASDEQDSGFVQQIRNTLGLIDADKWAEFILPSKKTTGDNYRFVVYLLKSYETATNNLRGLSFIIQNESLAASGGYVDGAEALEQATDTTGTNFNNELFTDQNLNSQINNDVIRTPSTIDPVSTVSGNNYHDETDVVLKGRGLNMAFTRTYNSGPTTINTAGLPMGFGWTHSYNMRLRSNDYGNCPNCQPGTGAGQSPDNGDGNTSSITYVDERGGEASYLVGPAPTSTITHPPGVFDSLQADWVTGTYILTFRNGVKYIFEGVAPDGDLRVPGRIARLARIEDPYGNVLTMTYDGSGRLSNVNDALGIAGRTGLTMTYHSDNRLKDISDWTGRTWAYGYDANGRLLTMTNPRNETITYEYQSGTNNLTGVILPEDRDSDTVGDVKTTFTYYQNGKTFSNANSFGQGEVLDYNLYRKGTKVTDPRGFTREYFYDKDGRLTKLEESDKAILQFENTSDGLRFKKTDGLGFSTTYSYRTDRSLTGGVTDTGGNVTLEQDALGNTVEIDFGIFDQPTRIKDKNGNEHTMTYYPTTDLPSGAVQGKLQRVSIKMGGADIPLQDFEYGAGGVLKEQIEYIEPVSPPNTSRTRTTTFNYDPTGLNLEEMLVSGSGQTIRTTFGYDSLGRRTSATRERQQSPTDPTIISLTTLLDYDELDRIGKVTDSIGNETITSFDKNGNVIQIKRRFKKPDSSFDERIISTKEYDQADRLIKDTDVNGDATQFRYDEAGNLIEITDANGHVTRFEYDAMGRQTVVINATGHRRESVYDLGGRMVKSIDPNGHVSQFTYDGLGRLITITDPLGFETTNTYDSNGNILTTTDANATAALQPTNNDGATISRQYDEFNRMIREHDAVNGDTLYAYDLLGNRTSLTDAEGRTTVFAYDDLGRLVTATDPLIETPTDKVTTLTYNQAGNVLTRTNRKDEVGRFTYDDLNRLVKAEYLVSSSVTYQEDFAYDHFGDRIMVKNDDVTYTFAYDTKHRVTTKMDNRPPSVITNSLQYSYDQVGNVSTKTDYQGAITDYRYDSANRIVSMRNPDYVEVSYQYDPAGRLLTRILSNGTTTSYGYDDNNRLVSLRTEHANGSVVGEESYTRDRIGNILTNSSSEGTTTFTYDPLYRLTDAVYPGAGNTYNYTYDGVGNRLTQTIDTTTQAYIYNEGNRLKEIRDGNITGPLVNQFYYDDNGNMIERRDGIGTLLQSYSTDAKGRIAQMTIGGQPFTYSYDPMGYRISKVGPGVAADYLLEGEHVEKVTGSHQPAQFFRGVVIDEIVNGYQYDPQGVWTNYTYAHDSLQSVVGLSGHEGATIQTTQYGPFGNEIDGAGASCSVLGYTGRERDAETRLYYYRARYYDPELGRFITEDPLGFSAGINFYTYVDNNPINLNDPTGESPAGIIQKAIDNGLRIVNKGLAGSKHPDTGIPFTKDGFPDFSGVAGKTVPVPQTGVRGVDFAAANKAAGFKSTPDGFTWHHVEDTQTMQLVPRDIHFSTGHTGGVGVTRFGGSAPAVAAVPAGAADGGNFLQDALEFLGELFNPTDLISGELSSDSFIPLGTLNVDPKINNQFLQSSVGAGGGFLLYPNKPNLNMLQSVYRK